MPDNTPRSNTTGSSNGSTDAERRAVPAARPVPGMTARPAGGPGPGIRPIPRTAPPPAGGPGGGGGQRPTSAGGRPAGPGGRAPARSGGAPRAGGRPSGGRQQGHRGAPSRGGPLGGPNGTKPAVATKPTGPIAIPSQVMVKDLAELLGATVNEVIRTPIANGVFANVNQVVGYDAAEKVASALGFEPSETLVSAQPSVAVRPEAASIGAAAHATAVGRVTRPPVGRVMC